MSKSMLMSAGALFLIFAAFSSGVYFLTHKNKPESSPENLITQKNALEANLAVAQDKLNKEKENLDTITNELRASFTLAAGIQDQMKKASEVVGQTNFMFINPDGSNPEFIVKNFPTSTLVNNERRDINILLAAWKTKTSVLSIRKIDLKETEQIRKDAQTIKTFIEDLSKLVRNLTPANSGLSQLQIDAYLVQLPSAGVIDQILASLSIAQTNMATNTGISSSQTSPSSSPSVPQVTPENVIVQQSVVAQAQNQVAVIQEQLTQIEEQIQQAAPPSTDTTANPAVQPVESQNINNTVDASIYFGNPSGRKITPTEGIVIQPGPPRLIQGSDPY